MGRNEKAPSYITVANAFTSDTLLTFPRNSQRLISDGRVWKHKELKETHAGLDRHAVTNSWS